MSLKYAFKTALAGLETNKSRSILTVLGIVIGVTAIILVMSVSRGAENLILAEVEGLGTKTIAVIPGREPRGPSDAAQIFSDSLKERDLEALRKKENAPAIAEIMPVVFGGESAAYGNDTYRLTIFGSSALIERMFDLYPDQGRFFTEEDIKGRADVTVIGSNVKEELFGASDALNEKIKIKDRNFRVIGVLPKKGQVAFFNFDEMALVPYTTAQQYIFGIKHFHRFIIEARSEDEIAETVRDIEFTLRANHGIEAGMDDDFAVQTQQDLADRVGSITRILTALLVSIAAISLVVGGIGIMNIMLVSVTERTREIGLRKALGATGTDIMLQFLIEAVLLTAIGGMIGIALGGLLSFAVSVVLSQFLDLAWSFSLPISAVVLGISVAGGVGLVFGLYPARQAARKSPIEALRYE